GDERRVLRERDTAFHRQRFEVERVEHVVAGHRSNFHWYSDSLRERDDRVGGSERIRRAEIAEKANPAARKNRQQRLDALGEPRIVSRRRIAAAPQLSERDGALGQAFED